MKFKPDDRLFLGFEPAPEPFTGRLADPIVRRNDLELAFEKLGEEVQTIFEKESERISSELREKLELLLEHYKISDVPTLWSSTANEISGLMHHMYASIAGCSILRPTSL